MIRRLRSLTLDRFRAFPAQTTIPLDADVVLLHGDNGSGKSSLLSALEFGLTGSVLDLRQLKEDYPQCLTHYTAPQPGAVQVTYQDTTGTEQTLHRHVGIHRHPENQLDSFSRRHFVERCYLSQIRLARLLESYQEIDSQKAEVSLLRLIRDLLGIDALDDLTTGLHEAGDIRRLRNGIPLYQVLSGELDDVRRRSGQLTADVASRVTTLREFLAALRPELNSFGYDVPYNASVRSIDHILTQIDRLQSTLVSDSLLATLPEDVDRLLIHGTALLSDPPEGIVAPSLIEAELQENEKRIATLSGHIADTCAQIADIIGVSTEMDGDQYSDLLDRLEIAARSQLESDCRIRTRHQEIITERREITDNISVTEELLRGLVSPTADAVAQQARWGEVLSNVLSHLDSDVCPICGRDFAETDSGSLRTHVELELKGLKKAIEVSSETLTYQSEQEDKLQQLRHTLSSLDSEMSSLEDPEVLESRSVRIGAVLDSLYGARTMVEEWSVVEQDTMRLKDRLTRSKSWYDSRRKTIESLSSVAISLGVDPPIEADDLLNMVSHVYRQLVKDDSEQSERLQKLSTGLKTALAMARDLEGKLTSAAKLRRRYERLDSADTDVKELAKEAREVRNVAAEIKRRLVHDVFSSNLNSLWTDLFGRLVKHETFRPKLDVEILARGKLRAKMRAAKNGDDAYEYLGSVLSTGNLNTAALTLFLALHLIEQPTNHVLVLDDPVQSMDDVHIVELAKLLRLISRQAGRQLILSIHEHSLVTYLETELGPADRDQRLITVYLERSGDWSHVTARQLDWQDDELHILA